MKLKYLRTSLLLIIVSFAFKSLRAADTKLVRNNLLEVEISAAFSTLLWFASPVITSVCQPSDVVSLEPLIKQISQFRSLANAKEGAQKEQADAEFAFYLKLSPLNNGNEVVCSFKLADSTQVSALFKLSLAVNRPLISFNQRNTTSFKDSNSASSISRILFKDLLSKQRIEGFKPITPQYRNGVKPATFRSKSVVYEYIYVAKSSNYTAVILKGYATAKFAVKAFVQHHVGEIILHSYVSDPTSYKDVGLVNKKDEFFLYILAGPALSIKRLQEVLL